MKYYFLDKNLLNMENKINSDEGCNYIQPHIIDEVYDHIESCIMMVYDDHLINIDNIVDYLHEKSKIKITDLSDFTFSYSLLKVLKENTEFLRLAYFKREGWFIVKIKGLCIHCLNGDCLY